MSGSFPFAPVVPSVPPLGGGQISPLAAALMGRTTPPTLSAPGGNFGAPLMSMLMQQQGRSTDPAFRRDGFRGGFDPTDGQQWGNVMSGHQWDGMPGQSPLSGMLGNGMNQYTQQAQANVAGMVPGMGTMGNGFF